MKVSSSHSFFLSFFILFLLLLLLLLLLFLRLLLLLLLPHHQLLLLSSSSSSSSSSSCSSFSSKDITVIVYRDYDHHLKQTNMALTFNWSKEVSVALRLAFRPCKPLNTGSIPEFSSHLDETCCCLYQRFRQVCIVSTGCIRTLFFQVETFAN